jgi:antirestriction protein ArdC
MKNQINAVSGKAVTGKNLEAVMVNRSRFGWKSDRWATYSQIKKAGAKLDSIRAKGKGVRCVSYPKGEAPIWFSLFNLDLVDGWPEPETAAKPQRKPGRPKGSKNKSSAEGRTVTLTEAQLQALIANAINQALAS